VIIDLFYQIRSVNFLHLAFQSVGANPIFGSGHPKPFSAFFRFIKRSAPPGFAAAPATPAPFSSPPRQSLGLVKRTRKKKKKNFVYF